MQENLLNVVICRGILFLLIFASTAWGAPNVGGPFSGKPGSRYQEMQKLKHQDSRGGVPAAILAEQSMEKIKIPSYDEAAKKSLAIAANTARPLLQQDVHSNGKTIRVPDDHGSIQDAIDAAEAGDIVLVKPGTYNELLVMKDGIKLMSDPAAHGDEHVTVKNALLKLPRRTLRTIIDGSGTQPSSHGMFDFQPGVGRKTIIDGFTIQNLPAQNHHIPGHAHALNVRGANPVIMNCLIRNNGSTGIGNHVVFHDQDAPMPERDFRWANVAYRTSAVIYHNIIQGNLGLGVGNNHYAEPFILGNEIFNNSDEDLGGTPTPGIGNKHGSAATIIGNIIHDNPGGGILCKEGNPQGKYHIDRVPHPSISKNVVYNNGTVRPGISVSAGGSETTPVKIVGNYVSSAGSVGIGLSMRSVGIINDNMVADSRLVGITINNATALQLNRNKVTGSRGGPGIAIVNNASVLKMQQNVSDSNMGPRFMAEQGSFEKRVPASGL